MDDLEVALNRAAIAIAKIAEDAAGALKAIDEALAPYREEWSDVVEVLSRSGDEEDRTLYDVCSYTECDTPTMHRHADQPETVMPRVKD